MKTERTLVILKPDCIRRHLIGQVIDRLERGGLCIEFLRLTTLPRFVVEEHYAEHEKKPFFQDLVTFLVSGPVIVMMLSGVRAVSIVRKLVGDTDSDFASPGTIRGDWGMGMQNLIHASSSVEAAEKELAILSVC